MTDTYNTASRTPSLRCPRLVNNNNVLPLSFSMYHRQQQTHHHNGHRRQGTSSNRPSYVSVAVSSLIACLLLTIVGITATTSSSMMVETADAIPVGARCFGEIVVNNTPSNTSYFDTAYTFLKMGLVVDVVVKFRADQPVPAGIDQTLWTTTNTFTIISPTNTEYTTPAVKVSTGRFQGGKITLTYASRAYGSSVFSNIPKRVCITSTTIPWRYVAVDVRIHQVDLTDIEAGGSFNQPRLEGMDWDVSSADTKSVQSCTFYSTLAPVKTAFATTEHQYQAIYNAARILGGPIHYLAGYHTTGRLGKVDEDGATIYSCTTGGVCTCSGGAVCHPGVLSTTPINCYAPGLLQYRCDQIHYISHLNGLMYPSNGVSMRCLKLKGDGLVWTFPLYRYSIGSYFDLGETYTPTLTITSPKTMSMTATPTHTAEMTSTPTFEATSSDSKTITARQTATLTPPHTSTHTDTPSRTTTQSVPKTTSNSIPKTPTTTFPVTGSVTPSISTPKTLSEPHTLTPTPSTTPSVPATNTASRSHTDTAIGYYAGNLRALGAIQFGCEGALHTLFNANGDDSSTTHIRPVDIRNRSHSLLTNRRIPTTTIYSIDTLFSDLDLACTLTISNPIDQLRLHVEVSVAIVDMEDDTDVSEFASYRPRIDGETAAILFNSNFSAWPADFSISTTTLRSAVSSFTSAYNSNNGLPDGSHRSILLMAYVWGAVSNDSQLIEDHTFLQFTSNAEYSISTDIAPPGAYSIQHKGTPPVVFATTFAQEPLAYNANVTMDPLATLAAEQPPVFVYDRAYRRMTMNMNTSGSLNPYLSQRDGLLHHAFDGDAALVQTNIGNGAPSYSLLWNPAIGVFNLNEYHKGAEFGLAPTLGNSSSDASSSLLGPLQRDMVEQNISSDVQIQSCHNLQYMTTSTVFNNSEGSSSSLVTPLPLAMLGMQTSVFGSSKVAPVNAASLPVSGPSARYACTMRIRLDMNVTFDRDTADADYVTSRTGLFTSTTGYTTKSMNAFVSETSRSVISNTITTGTVDRFDDDDACLVRCVASGTTCAQAATLRTTSLTVSGNNRVQDVVVEVSFSQMLLSGEVIPGVTTTYIRCPATISTSDAYYASTLPYMGTITTTPPTPNTVRQQIGVSGDPVNSTCFAVALHVTDIPASSSSSTYVSSFEAGPKTSRQLSQSEILLHRLSISGTLVQSDGTEVADYLTIHPETNEEKQEVSMTTMACLPDPHTTIGVAIIFVVRAAAGSWISGPDTLATSTPVDPCIITAGMTANQSSACPSIPDTNVIPPPDATTTKSPIISYVSGCIDGFPNTGACSVTGRNTITIVGGDFTDIIEVQILYPDTTIVPCDQALVIVDANTITCQAPSAGPQTLATLINGVVQLKPTAGVFTTTPYNSTALRTYPTISFNAPLASCKVAANSTSNCSGNGDCLEGVECLCFADSSVSGHWQGTYCTTCADQWTGSDCTLQCGSNSDDVSCDMCSGHGLCSIAADSGESTCVCDEGWRGERCDDCSEAAYGISCQLACPKSTIGAVCYGHGTCDSGVYGSGKCTCQTGFDAVESCSMCEDGFTGYPTCGTLCGRDSFAGKVCSGHGTCRSQPNGTCSCETGFSGTRCEINCPVDTAGQLCGGNGVCSSNNNCTCNSPFAANTTTGLCTACVKGYYGANCSLSCLPCQNGACSTTGVCTCTSGFWGPACSKYCPGKTPTGGSSCNSHGTCAQSTGICTCHASTALGYFVGEQCNYCRQDYASGTCKIACPSTTSDGICNGRGSCYNGACTGCTARNTDSSLFICGNGCDKFASDCFNFSHSCPTGTWGASCTQQCPIAGPSSDPCSGIGVCNVNSGECICPSGYSGSACHLTCPKNPSTGISCSNRGSCPDASTVPDGELLVCTCVTGYGGDACETECPGGAAAPCNNRGTCTSRYATCECTLGWGGAACELECPGGNAAPCGFNGECQVDASCLCYSDATQGYYAGTQCDDCETGWAGETCTAECSPVGSAQTSNRQCVCLGGYGGELCENKCPIDSSTGVVCGLNGQCSVVTGTCSCNSGWFGPLCSTFCTPADCTEQQQLVNPQCSDLGECICVYDSVQGYYSGGTCSDCDTFFWGSQCTLPCPCNNNGACDRDTGECQCFSDSERGYWTGDSCSECLGGYSGGDCKRPNVEFSDAATSSLLRQYSATTPRNVLIHDTTSQSVVMFDWVQASTTSTIGILSTGTPTARNTPIKFTINAQLVGTIADVLSSHPTTVAFLLADSTTTITATVAEIESVLTGIDTTSTLSTLITTGTTTISQIPHSNIIGLLPTSKGVIRATAAVSTTSAAWNITLNSNTVITPPSASFYSGSTITAITWQGPTTNSVEGIMLVGSTLVAERTVNGVTLTDVLSGLIVVGTIEAGQQLVNWRVVRELPDVTAVSRCTLRRLKTSPTSTDDAQFIVPCALVDAGGVSIKTILLVHSSSTTNGGGSITIADAVPSTRLAPSQTSPSQITCTAMVLEPLLTTPDPIDVGACSTITNTTSTSSTTSSLNAGSMNECFDYGYVACSPLNSGYSNLYRFSLRTNDVHGNLFIASPITAMSADYSQRVLYVLLHGDSLRTLNTFGVQQVRLSLLDSSGGAPVEMAIEGILPSMLQKPSPTLVPACVFQDANIPSTNYSISADVFGSLQATITLACIAPTTNASGCVQAPVDMSLPTRRTAVQDTPTAMTRFASTAQIFTARSSVGVGYGSAVVATDITVEGIGFIPLGESDMNRANPMCRIVGPSGITTGDDVTMPATLTSFLSATCKQPRLGAPTTPGSTLQFSHDGTVFTPVGVLYVAAGAAASYSIQNTDANLIVVSGTIATSPRVTVHTVDTAGNSLLALDVTTTQQLTVTFLYHRLRSTFPAGSSIDSSDVVDDRTISQSISISGTVVGGVWVADSLSLYYPIAGYGLVQVDGTSTSSYGTRTYDVRAVSVIAGAPATIALRSAEATSTILIGVTEILALPSLEFTIADTAGNEAAFADSLPNQLVLTLPMAREKTAEELAADASSSSLSVSRPLSTSKRSMRAASSVLSLDQPFVAATINAYAIRGSQNSYIFTDARARTYFSEIGVSLTVSPFGTNASSSGIDSMVLQNVPVERCFTDEYAIINTFSCAACPTHAICDGGFTVSVANGYWRASDASLSIYPCPLGSCSEESECEVGYTGPKCSVCDEGYGISGEACRKCIGTTADIVLSLLYCIALFALVTVLTISSLRPTLTEPNRIRSRLTIVLKTLISHGQLVALILAVYPNTTLPIASSLLRGGAGASSLSPNLSFMSCAFFPTAYERYMFFGTYGPVGYIGLVAIVAILASPFILVPRPMEDRDERIKRRLDKGIAKRRAQRPQRTIRMDSPNSDQHDKLVFSGIGGGMSQMDGELIFSRSIDDAMLTRQEVYIHIDSPSASDPEDDDAIDEVEAALEVSMAKGGSLRKNKSNGNSPNLIPQDQFASFMGSLGATPRSPKIEAASMVRSTRGDAGTPRMQPAQFELSHMEIKPFGQSFTNNKSFNGTQSTGVVSRRVSGFEDRSSGQHQRHPQPTPQRIRAEQRLSKLLQFESEIPPGASPTQHDSMSSSHPLSPYRNGGSEGAAASSQPLALVSRRRSSSRTRNSSILHDDGNGTHHHHQQLHTGGSGVMGDGSSSRRSERISIGLSMADSRWDINNPAATTPLSFMEGSTVVARVGGSGGGRDNNSNSFFNSFNPAMLAQNSSYGNAASIREIEMVPTSSGPFLQTQVSGSGSMHPSEFTSSNHTEREGSAGAGIGSGNQQQTWTPSFTPLGLPGGQQHLRRSDIPSINVTSLEDTIENPSAKVPKSANNNNNLNSLFDETSIGEHNMSGWRPMDNYALGASSTTPSHGRGSVSKRGMDYALNSFAKIPLNNHDSDDNNQNNRSVHREENEVENTAARPRSNRMALWRRCCRTLPPWMPLRRITPLAIVQCVVVSTVVVLFYFYPSTIATSAALLPCESIHSSPLTGTPSTNSYLSSDMAIDCDTEEHSVYTQRAVVSIIAYGLGTPLVMTLGVFVVARAFFGGDMDKARQVFFFTTAGFREDRWFWEAVVMLRKAAVVLAVTIPTDPYTRTVIVTWLIIFFLALNIIARPYDSAALGAVENASLAVLLVSFSVLFLHPQMEDDNRVLLFGGSVVLIVNVLFLVLAVGVMIYIITLVVKAYQTQYTSRLERRLEVVHNLRLLSTIEGNEEIVEALRQEQKDRLEALEVEEALNADASNAAIATLIQTISRIEDWRLARSNARAVKLSRRVTLIHPRSFQVGDFVLNEVLRDTNVMQRAALAIVLHTNSELYISGGAPLAYFERLAEEKVQGGALWADIATGCLMGLTDDKNKNEGYGDNDGDDGQALRTQSSSMSLPGRSGTNWQGIASISGFVMSMRADATPSSATANIAVSEATSRSAELRKFQVGLLEHIHTLCQELSAMMIVYDQAAYRIGNDRKRGTLTHIGLLDNVMLLADGDGFQVDEDQIGAAHRWGESMGVTSHMALRAVFTTATALRSQQIVPEERLRENYHQKRVDDAADLLQARAIQAQTPKSSDGLFSQNGMVLFNGLSIEPHNTNSEDNTLASNDLPASNSYTIPAAARPVATTPTTSHTAIDLTSNETAVFAPVATLHPLLPSVSPTWSPGTSEPPSIQSTFPLSPNWSSGIAAPGFTVTSASDFVLAGGGIVANVSSGAFAEDVDGSAASFRAPSVAHTTVGRQASHIAEGKQQSTFGSKGRPQIAIETSPYDTCIGQRRRTAVKSQHGSQHNTKGGGGSRVFSHTAGSIDSKNEEEIKEIIPKSNGVSRKTEPQNSSSNDTAAPPPRRGGGGTANNTYVLSSRSSMDISNNPVEIMNLFPVLDAPPPGTTAVQMEPTGVFTPTPGEAQVANNNSNNTEVTSAATPLTSDEAQAARKRCTNCNSTVAQRLEDLLQFEAAVLTIAKMLVEAVYWYESAMKDATRNADAEAR